MYSKYNVKPGCDISACAIKGPNPDVSVQFGGGEERALRRAFVTRLRAYC